MYLSRIPAFIQALFPRITWRIPDRKKTLYLTFDDGPSPDITQKVLAILNRFDARATFFLLGQQAEAFPELVRLIRREGHMTGLHTYSHLDGWKTKDNHYLADLEKGRTVVEAITGQPARLFRPPYGRIRLSQAKKIRQQRQIVMMDVISGDFDRKKDGRVCAKAVIRNAKAGSVILFHDSEQAWERLSVALPLILEYFSEKGFSFEPLPAPPGSA